MDEDFTAKCEDCGEVVYFYEIAAIVPRNPADPSCSGFTDTVKYCRKCWPKHAEKYQS